MSTPSTVLADCFDAHSDYSQMQQTISPTDIIGETSQDTGAGNDSSQVATPSTKARGPKFSTFEDVTLYKCYLNVSTDSREGTDRKRSDLWSDIAASYAVAVLETVEAHDHPQSAPLRSAEQLSNRSVEQYPKLQRFTVKCH